MDDVMHAGHLLLRALCEANRKIVEGVTDLWEAGTTTVLAGIVLQTTADSGKPEWGLLCASVGDCKALLWNKRTGNFTDITMGNRCTDMRDPGGRLGPYLGKDPDLRNLRLYWRVVYPGDIIIFCTDGIYDNFDPIFLGKSPKDLELPYTVWSGVPDTTQEQKKEEFALKFAKGLMQGKEITPSSLIDTFVEHATNLTSRTRDFMESHPGKKQPADYKLFPGKMVGLLPSLFPSLHHNLEILTPSKQDHTTALAFVVGSVPTAVKAQTVTVEIPPPQVEAPLATAVDDKGKKPAS